MLAKAFVYNLCTRRGSTMVLELRLPVLGLDVGTNVMLEPEIWIWSAFGWSIQGLNWFGVKLLWTN